MVIYYALKMFGKIYMRYILGLSSQFFLLAMPPLLYLDLLQYGCWLAL